MIANNVYRSIHLYQDYTKTRASQWMCKMHPVISCLDSAFIRRSHIVESVVARMAWRGGNGVSKHLFFHFFRNDDHEIMSSRAYRRDIG
ncbi:hypothetical protein BJX99DRAFT_230454 [Aspergillus californicus]